MKLNWFAALTMLGLVAICSAEVRAEEESRVGRKIESFTLPDYYGKDRSFDDLADGKLTVVAFLGTECPLVRLYGPRLAEMAEEYAAKGVHFIGINSNQQDTINEMGAFARQYGIKFPILKDAGNVVADQFGAIRTPEVFVLDGNRVVRYWGRIDDQYGLGATSGYAKSDVQNRDLATAIDELLAGKEVTQPVTKALGCLIGRVQHVAPHGEITYSNQIARIMQNRCVECHREGQVGPFTLTSYEDAAGWADMMCEVVGEGRMPPWFANPEYGHFVNDARLTDEEKQTIFQWVENGCPEGDPKDLPEPRQFAEGWSIPEPDAVFYMSEEPTTVQAEGTIDYRYFTVDPGFTEDKWIRAAEARPGNRSVVHHIIVFIQRPGDEQGERGLGAAIGYAPGMQPRVFRDDMAILIPAGSKLRFQMHYTSAGTEQQDRSCVGFVFADPQTVKKHVRGGVSGNVSLRIPPNDPNFEVTSTKRFRRDTLLLSMLPHMHLRGKSFRYELEYPDGQREIVLDIPRYDFNWQLWYELKEPKLIPAGTKMHCTAHFDNSSENPYNPDPNREITWGEQTWEEMMFGFITTADPSENLSLAEEDDLDDVPADKIAF